MDNGYVFQLVPLEVQGSLGKSSEIFFTRPPESALSFARRSTSWQLFEATDSALQIGSAACVLGTVSNRGAVEEIYYIACFSEPLYRLQL